MRTTSLLKGALGVLAGAFVVSLFANGTAEGCWWRHRSASAPVYLCPPLYVVPAAPDSAGRQPEQLTEPWGNIQGRVVWGPDQLPKPADKDLIIDPKTKAIKNAFVWLVLDSKDSEDLTKPIPIHPDLRERKKEVVNVEIANGQFVPSVIVLRDGQSVVFTNKKKTGEVLRIFGDERMKNKDVILGMGAGESAAAGPFHVEGKVITVDSVIDANLTASVWVLSHPYYCVTEADGRFVIKNAPAGTYRLKVWQPGHGWVVGEKTPDKFGVPIRITGGKTLDLGDIKMKPWD